MPRDEASIQPRLTKALQEHQRYLLIFEGKPLPHDLQGKLGVDLQSLLQVMASHLLLACADVDGGERDVAVEEKGPIIRKSTANKNDLTLKPNRGKLGL